MATGEVLSAADVQKRVVSLLRERLPETWNLTEAVASGQGSLGPDLSIQLAAPDGQVTRLLVEAKQLVERRDVATLAHQVRLRAADVGEVPVVAARYLSPSVRQALTEEGLSYADATGNLRVLVDSPVLFIADRGEDRDPWRKGRPRGTLKGEPAARVARALVDYARDWSVRELIAVSGASTGATYRVLEYLEREDLVTKKEKRYRVTDWERLLRAWSADASFQTTTRVMAFIEPRGVDAFLTKVAKQSAFPTAVTGSIAAKEWATYAPAKAAYVYVSSIQEASEQWGLRPNAAAPNVILLEPKTVGDVPFQNASKAEGGYPIAAPAQVAADLLNGPGREPVEGEFLIEWMKANEERWRSD
ncbi:hypothetical protein N802_16610 [Knoellia sinensis KCTC 19936]|uniref:HTH iclR-type domain-containing protein n=1 Tax=Knoellia sinensis KCTC 19936 TaxID=1385520 RepID=A0A0A0J8F1_9MICO|nr:hypothetical protein [Knoellia sinensis]KGN32994.1 hypothetical protein N802_16610 [Knoellia sinensis KCTC 19936]